MIRILNARFLTHDKIWNLAIVINLIDCNSIELLSRWLHVALLVYLVNKAATLRLTRWSFILSNHFHFRWIELDNLWVWISHASLDDIWLNIEVILNVLNLHMLIFEFLIIRSLQTEKSSISVTAINSS